VGRARDSSRRERTRTEGENGGEAAPASALYNVTRTFITFVFGLALTLLMARWLGPDEYAVYGVLATLVVTGVALARLSLDTASSRFVAEMRGRGLPAEAARITSMLLRWEAVLCAVVCAGLALASPYLSARYGDLAGHERLVVLAAVAVGPEALGLVLAGVLKGLGRYGYLARVSFWLSPASFVGSVAAMRLGFGVAGLLAVRLLVSIVRVVLIKREAGVRWEAQPADDPVLRRRLLGFVAVWSWLMIVDMVVWEQSEIYFLGIFWPGHQVAFYTLAFSLSARAMALLPLAVGDVVIPTASRAFGQGGDEALGRIYNASTRYLVLLAVPVAVVGIVLADAVVRLGAGADYAPAVPLLRVLLVSASLGAIGAGSWAVLTAAERRRALAIMGASAVAVNIALDLLLIPRQGAAGAAAANFIAQALPVTAGAVYTCVVFRTSFPWTSLGRSVLACIPSAVSLVLARRLLPGPVGIGLGLVSAAALYVLVLTALGAVRTDDVRAAETALRFMPAGTRERILLFLRRHARGSREAERDT
jgi:O-antigen/teichoic acid export membrane protein